MLLIFASTAIEDLDDLWDWVGADSPDAADRRLAGIRETCLRLQTTLTSAARAMS